MRLSPIELLLLSFALLAIAVALLHGGGRSGRPRRVVPASWSLTPGVLNPEVTQATIRTTGCRSSWNRTFRHPGSGGPEGGCYLGLAEIDSRPSGRGQLDPQRGPVGGIGATLSEPCVREGVARAAGGRRRGSHSAGEIVQAHRAVEEQREK